MRNMLKKFVSNLCILALIISMSIPVAYAQSTSTAKSIDVTISSAVKSNIGNIFEAVKKSSAEESAAPDNTQVNAAAIVDPYEPNNDISSPSPMPGDLIDANIGYSGDMDLYTKDFSAGQNVEVWLKNIPYGCDYDLYICDLNGNILARSENYGASSELIQAVVNVAGTYIVAVLPYTGYNSNQQYKLYAGNAQTQSFADSLSSATEIDTYSATVDYSVTSSAAICLVRTGNAGISATVKDSSGNVLNGESVYSDDEYANTTAKNWIILNKPSGTDNVYTYTITVEAIANQYDSNSNYRLTVGDSEFIEALVSGIDNTVILKKYTNTAGNYYYTNYIPNNYESYFKFVGDGRTVITLLSDYPGLRFKILDPVTYTVLYDTNASTSSSAHRTTYIAFFESCEKATLQTSPGKEYLLAIYTPYELRYPNSLVTGFFNLAVGEGNTLPDSVSVYSNQYTTGTSSGFSPSATISVRNVPRTAYATDVYFLSATSGVYLSDIEQWRVRRTNESTWRTSGLFYPAIDIPYAYGSTSNSLLSGDWYFSFKSSRSSTSLSFKPGMRIEYVYELGD